MLTNSVNWLDLDQQGRSRSRLCLVSDKSAVADAEQP